MTDPGHISPAAAFALVGILGVGSQWLAWRLRLPAIVLMLLAGILVGPVAGVFDPSRDIGPLAEPLISLAVAVILFEGGLSLHFEGLDDARDGVRRLVVIGAPLGWLLSTLALVWGAGLGWEAAAVFGGIMIVTGPTVIAPLLRQARLARRPAALLQWEAIVNDPLGALAALFAFGVVQVLHDDIEFWPGFGHFVLGITLATVFGLAAGRGIAWAFRGGRVPEYMKVPVLFVVLIGVFAASDMILHESGLLAVTVMGVVIANANLPSYVELRRFKEHATVLLVSGVFILLAARLDFAELARLNWRAAIFVAAVIFVARPLTVLIALAGSSVPMTERIFVGFTGPRGVVLIAVAGLFGERLAEAGVADGALIGPLAFVLVLATVILHGFTLAPFARALGLAGREVPGVIFVGGSRFTTALGECLKGAGVPVLIADPNHARLIRPRSAGLPTFYGDVLSESAEHTLELFAYRSLVAATDNDAYNTLVATDLGPEFGRGNVWQIGRDDAARPRHALPVQLGGRAFAETLDFAALEARLAEGWRIGLTKLGAEFGLADWRAARPGGILIGRLTEAGELLLYPSDADPKLAPGARILTLTPPEAATGAGAPSGVATGGATGGAAAMPGPAAPLPG